MSKFTFKYGRRKQAVKLDPKTVQAGKLTPEEIENAKRIEAYLKGIPQLRYVPTKER